MTPAVRARYWDQWYADKTTDELFPDWLARTLAQRRADAASRRLANEAWAATTMTVRTWERKP